MKLSFLKKLLGQDDLSPEEKEEKKLTEIQLMEKYFGKSTGFFNKLNLSLYRTTIQYFEDFVINTDEEVLSAILAEYDTYGTAEDIKGLLIATSQRLVFVTNSIEHGKITEIFEYHKINRMALAPDELGQKEFLIYYGDARKKFDDILNDDHFKNFLQIVRKKIQEARANKTSSQF